MTRYRPSRHYLHAGLAALASAAISGWCGLSWPLAWVAAALFLATAGALLFLALRPVIEVHDTHLAMGREVIPWTDIRRVDHAGWIAPLVIHLSLFDGRRRVLIYPGEPETSSHLLRQLRRLARHALIEGVPHGRFWGEALPPAADREALPSPRYRLLRPDDEAEVERLFQRLKTVGHLDQKNSTEEE